MELSGKTAFVTGGSGDIGCAIAKALAARGVDVAISYVENAQGADRTVAAVKEMGQKGIAEQAVLFCKSDSITGQLMVIDGGMPAAMH